MSSNWRLKINSYLEEKKQEEERKKREEQERYPKEYAEKLALHQARFHCHIPGCPRTSKGPHKEQYDLKTLAQTQTGWPFGLSIDWDRPTGGIKQCNLCGEWTCFNHLHRGICIVCAEAMQPCPIGMTISPERRTTVPWYGGVVVTQEVFEELEEREQELALRRFRSQYFCIVCGQASRGPKLTGVPDGAGGLKYAFQGPSDLVQCPECRLWICSSADHNHNGLCEYCWEKIQKKVELPVQR